MSSTRSRRARKSETIPTTPFGYSRTGRQRPYHPFQSDTCGQTDRNHLNCSFGLFADGQTEAIPTVPFGNLRIDKTFVGGKTEAIPINLFGYLRIGRQKPSQLVHSDICGWTGRSHSNYSIRMLADGQTETTPIIPFRYMRMDKQKPSQLFKSDTCG